MLKSYKIFTKIFIENDILLVCLAQVAVTSEAVDTIWS